MNESDFKASEVSAAFLSWFSYFGRTLSFYEVGTRSFKVLSILTPIFAHPLTGILLGAQRWVQAIKTHVAGKREVDEEFVFMAALILLSSWAAFEAYVDDICKAVLRMDHALLTTGTIATVRLSQAETQLDDFAKFDVYLRKGVMKDNSAKTPVEKIECQLKLVGLDGPIPQDVIDNLNTSKYVRNVWAHKAGKADRYFVDNCPATTFNIGDTVTVSEELLGSYVVGMVCYGIIVVNRFRIANGLQPFETYQGTEERPNPLKASVDQLFPDTVSWEVLRDA